MSDSKNDIAVFRTLNTVHLWESTIDEEDSYGFMQYYYLEKYMMYRYSSPDIYSFEELDEMSSNFCLFFGKITDNSNKSLSSPIPLFVFRYLLLADGQYSSYYTVRKKPGYVVEGLAWSNGMTYQVREDKDTEFEIYQKVLFVDHQTKTLHKYP